MSEDEDESLKAQIRACLDYERQDLDAFFKNTEGFIYVARPCEGNAVYGYCANAKTARARGLRRGCGLEIAKYRIVGLAGQETRKSKGNLGLVWKTKVAQNNKYE